MSLVAASLKNNLVCEKKNNCKLFLTAERRKNKIKVFFRLKFLVVSPAERKVFFCTLKI